MPDIDFYIDAPPKIIKSVTQNGHGFVVGNAVRVSGTNTYTLAQSNTLANSRAVGIVSEVTSVNEFVVTMQGQILSGVPAVAAGTVMYVSDSVAGALTSTAPSSNVNPIMVVTENGVSAIVICSLVGLEGGSAGAFPFGATDAATSPDYTVTVNPAVGSYVNGASYLIFFSEANTGPSTLDINGLGALPIRKNGQIVLIAGDISVNQIYQVVYDGSINMFQLEGWIGGPSITPADLTKTDDTNVTLTLGGTPTGALLQAVSLTLGWTGLLSLARGGTNKNMTPVAGGIVWTDADSMEVIAAGTAGQVLVSGGSSAPTWGEIIKTIRLTGGSFTTTSATITDITGMSVPVEANSVYIVEFNCRHGCDNTGGSNFGWNAPAGATYGGHLLGRVTVGNPPVGSGVSGSGASASTLAFNTANSQFGYIQQRLLVVTGANAGNFDLRTNSVVGGQTTTIQADGTYIKYLKIG